MKNCIIRLFFFFILQHSVFSQVDSIPEPYRRFMQEEKVGIVLYGKGNYEAAIIQFEKTQLLSDSLEKFLPTSLDTLKKWDLSIAPYRKLNLLNNINACKAQLGRFDESFSILVNDIIPLARELSSPNLFPFLNNAGSSYNDIGQLDKASIYLNEALVVFQHKKQKKLNDTLNYANVVSNLGYNHEKRSQMLEALPFYQEALYLRRQQKDVARLGIALMRLGNAYFLNGRMDSAYLLLKESLAIADTNKTWREHADWGITTHYMGEYFEKIGQIDSANVYFQKAFDFQKKQYGLAHNRTLRSTMMSGLTLASLQQFDQSSERLHLFNSARNDYNNSNFAFLTDAEREPYLQNVQYQFNIIQSVGLQKKQADALSDIMFENALLYKGILLQQNRLSTEALKNRTDSTTIRQLQERERLKKIIDREETRPLSMRSSKYDSLNQVLLKIESSLFNDNKLTEKQTQLFTAQQAQKLLKPTDALVEFVHFMAKDSQVWYGAYVLRPYFDRPQWVLLFKENLLDSILYRNRDAEQMVAALYRGTRGIKPVSSTLKTNLYDLIWSPLDTFLKGAKQVYYAPSGLLHRVAMESIPLRKGGVLSDSFNLAYISSSRSLLTFNQLNSKMKWADAVIFGDIDYNKEGIKSIAKDNLAMRSPAPKRSNRETWTHLDATKQEAEVINAILKKAHIATTVLTQNAASEESFKALGSGLPSPSIIHLATHGYFFNQNTDASDTTENNTFIQSSQPLIRSGLILAGGNKTWQGKIPDEGHEDGILTAYEISHLNLENTQLAVLSACETGLGDIRGSEGVFGLQRAFKMAGVRYLLVSLWKIPDAPTAELMQLFYQNLTTDNNVRQAFQNARKVMRLHYPNTPLNWAGFVLME